MPPKNANDLRNDGVLHGYAGAEHVLHEVLPGAGCTHVVETASGFVIRNPAPGASPPSGPDPISRAVNSR